MPSDIDVKSESSCGISQGTVIQNLVSYLHLPSQGAPVFFFFYPECDIPFKRANQSTRQATDEMYISFAFPVWHYIREVFQDNFPSLPSIFTALSKASLTIWIPSATLSSSTRISKSCSFPLSWPSPLVILGRSEQALPLASATKTSITSPKVTHSPLLINSRARARALSSHPADWHDESKVWCMLWTAEVAKRADVRADRRSEVMGEGRLDGTITVRGISGNQLTNERRSQKENTSVGYLNHSFDLQIVWPTEYLIDVKRFGHGQRRKPARMARELRFRTRTLGDQDCISCFMGITGIHDHASHSHWSVIQLCILCRHLISL